MKSIRQYPSVAGVSLACLFLAGCLQVPFCIPELNYAPSVDAHCPRDEIRVFRVDVTQSMEITESRSGALHGTTVEAEELTRVHVGEDGTTLPQMGLACAYGWRIVGFRNELTSLTGHALGLRFYRPGFETIVVKPGQAPGELEWKQATDLIAEVKAIDDLVGIAPLKSTSKATMRHVLHPGRKSSAQREALLFAAGEYERLTKQVATRDALDEELRTRLREKAERLRTLADAKTASEP
jgi:hypothetical protein